jgi:ElaB/YqjD/DUF883 family membrane-anchored ribosome-binding protein
MEDEAVIRSQMEETRTALSEKVGQLEEQVVNTVQGATDAVAETVATVKDTVESTVSSVKDSVQEGVEAVKGAFDVSSHVENHPWLMMGSAAALGYCLASWLSPKSTAMTAGMSTAAKHEPASGGRMQHSTNGGHHRRHRESKPAAPSFLAELGPEIDKIKGLALGAVLGTFREMLIKGMPEHLGHQLGEIINSVTEKMGGNPLPESDWNFSAKERREESTQSSMEAGSRHSFGK